MRINFNCFLLIFFISLNGYIILLNNRVISTSISILILKVLSEIPFIRFGILGGLIHRFRVLADFHDLLLML